MKRYSLIFTLISLFLVACSGPRSYAEREGFRSDPRHSRNFTVTAEPVFEAARRVLLRDGYLIVNSAERSMVGVKEFQMEENRHAILRLYATSGHRTGGSTLFVTATEEHFDIKTSRESTSIGVPLLVPFSLSTSAEVDNQVKILGETVKDKNFYERFYRAVQQELAQH